LLTWEPWDPAQGTNQPAYRLATITSGAHDAYIAHWAQQIKTWGRPLFLRFAHEMNGSWYPWSEQRNGNGPGDFVRAWNHVQAVFAANGVTNATWVWSPNVSYPGATEMQELYPGDAAVGAVGIDGYNSGTAPGGTGWVSFSDLFGPTLAHVRSFSHRPLLISEIASTESGGNKAAWITDMFSRLAAQPDVRLFVWFNSNKETDWRIESSPGATQAFAAGVAANVSP
jgi:beta-mannanase